MTSDREISAIIALLRHPGVAQKRVADLVQDHGSAVEALERLDSRVPDEALQLFREVSSSPSRPPLAADLPAIAHEVSSWLAEGMRLTTVLDPDYPENLHTVHDRPPLLFVHGALQPTDEKSVAIVGTRKASEAGLATARTMAARMVDHGYAVVSGLAAGIDTAAHRAALEAGGRTVAVIGTGLRHVFPKVNAELQRQLGRDHAVISQFWPDQGPRPWTFPLRNAVMSGFAQATVVIEASDTSGARTQARLALGHGRPVFLLRSVLKHRWAEEHSRQPGSHVVDTPEEVIDILQREHATASFLTT